MQHLPLNRGEIVTGIIGPGQRNSKSFNTNKVLLSRTVAELCLMEAMSPKSSAKRYPIHLQWSIKALVSPPSVSLCPSSLIGISLEIARQPSSAKTIAVEKCTAMTLEHFFLDKKDRISVQKLVICYIIPAKWAN